MRGQLRPEKGVGQTQSCGRRVVLSRLSALAQVIGRVKILFKVESLSDSWSPRQRDGVKRPPPELPLLHPPPQETTKVTMVPKDDAVKITDLGEVGLLNWRGMG